MCELRYRETERPRSGRAFISQTRQPESPEISAHRIREHTHRSHGSSYSFDTLGSDQNDGKRKRQVCRDTDVARQDKTRPPGRQFYVWVATFLTRSQFTCQTEPVTGSACPLFPPPIEHDGLRR